METEIAELNSLPSSVQDDLKQHIASDSYDLIAIDPEFSDTANFCEKYGFSSLEGANCIVLKCKKEGERSYAVALIRADSRLDVNKTCKKALAVSKVSFADQNDAVELTGMEYGGITPIGLPKDWKILVDPQVLDVPKIIIGSGVRSSKIHIEPSEVLKLPNAELVENLSQTASSI